MLEGCHHQSKSPRWASETSLRSCWACGSEWASPAGAAEAVASRPATAMMVLGEKYIVGWVERERRAVVDWSKGVRVGRRGVVKRMSEESETGSREGYLYLPEHGEEP